MSQKIPPRPPRKPVSQKTWSPKSQQPKNSSAPRQARLPKPQQQKSTHPTSWENVSQWYDEKVGEQGQYYHQALIMPNVMKLLALTNKKETAILDLACGQGILSRSLTNDTPYMGVDISPALIRAARQYSKVPAHQYIVADVTKPLPLDKKDFSHATLILALQNIEEPLKAFKNVYNHLRPGAPFIIVLNHPCFRIPRQSSWKVDQAHKIQYRRIDRYMSDMSIPVFTNPGKGSDSSQSLSFHHPLSTYSRWLNEAGFTIALIDEWCSPKVSEGGAAKMENRSREEIPLFMAIVAIKKVMRDE